MTDRPRLAWLCCPDCGELFHPDHIDRHRLFEHPGSATKPAKRAS